MRDEQFKNKMTITPVADMLPAGISSPAMNALAADANNYTALLLQPRGVIDATNAEIQSRNRDLARAQFGQFLAHANESQPDLVITPEYSMPWEILRQMINGGGAGPGEGKLWVLGCESIRYSALQQAKIDLADVAEVLFEDLKADDTKFVDPLAYVFRAPTADRGPSRLIVLVQFKTHAMGGDPHDFERNHLQIGNKVYQFGEGLGIRLTSFICSDCLALTDIEAARVRDRGLIIHIQLNPKRQHANMRSFRERLLKHAGRSTEIVTLNWACDTCVFVDGHDTKLWKFAGSAWCIKADDVDLADATVQNNHRKGLYYTWLNDHRTHTMFFNFDAAMFQVTASKVDRSNVVGPAGNRRGPQLDSVRIWDGATMTWSQTTALDDGFAAVLPESGHASDSIKATYDVCPLACERLIALCSGKCITCDDWQTITHLRSFGLAPDELILRFTFCQPKHATSIDFRREHMRRCSNLWNELTKADTLPPFLKDAKTGFQLRWSGDRPHQNLIGADGEYATVAHLGDSSQDEAESVHGAIRKHLHQTLPEDADGHEHNPGSTWRAKQRIALWYIDNVGNTQLYVKTPSIADAHEDPADIRRAS